MKKFVNSVEPRAIAASGVDAAAVAQANLSTEKDITQLLGASNETEDSIGGNGCNNKGCQCGNRRASGKRDGS